MEILECKPLNGKKVAVVGSGPAGLSIAGLLALDGYKVTVYEKEAKAGGYLRYGIPEYRLPEGVLDQEIKYITDLGVVINCNSRIENPEDLKKDSSYTKYIYALYYGNDYYTIRIGNKDKTVLIKYNIKKIT